ncbi:MAG TPA: translocation/assembly module TamB domain-containing protein [Thermoanaerobaculia bacterium]|nr:translocation/assembly module TamB domain-containing protein [Thermoanaerobaculia bacterium]
MWGCLKWLIGAAILFFLILFLTTGGFWIFIGTPSFANLVALRVASTLESRLGRKVTIGAVVIDRVHLSKVVLKDLRVANSPGAVNPYFATVKEITITGGVNSFWGRQISVNRVDIVEPHLFFEIYPAGSKLVHNFPHWNPGPKGRYDIYHLSLHKMFITQGGFDFLDRRHNIAAGATNIASTVDVTGQDVYAGTGSSPLLRVRIQDYEPFDMNMRGQFRYAPGVLELQSVALNGGPDLKVFLKGRLDPLTDGVYNLRLTSALGLNRIQQIFRVQRSLEGIVQMDAALRGKQGTFKLNGGWISSRMKADVYALADARGNMNITDTRAIVDVERASYGGGTIAAHYTLPQYSEPYPMSADLRYNGVSVEKLFSDWGIQDNGLRAGAMGRLSYHWKKDKLLEGGGEGTATLSKNATAFSGAKYPIAVGGSTDFALDNGVVTFRRADLETDKSKVAIAGKFRIADAWTDVAMKIHSDDFSELDRVGYNFAHSAGKKTYTLLGLGGAADINGSVQGRIKAPGVVAHIAGTATKYNNVLLGDSDIDLHYDGVHSTLRFDRASFREGGRLSLTGTVAFPERGPSPRFDIAVDATNYPVDRAVSAVNLKFAVAGLGTGRIVVTGTPDAGKVTFASLTVTQAGGATLNVSGSTEWQPGKGNVVFDLTIDAKSFPVADIVKFLDLGTLPVTGQLTGSLKIQGPKSGLEGAGTVTVTNGSIYGEAVTQATANIAFTKGTLKATNVSVIAPAGTATGEAELNLNTNQFNYSIQSSSIDLSKLKALSTVAALLGGNITLTSTGGGTFQQPELEVNATLNQATLRGLNLPPGSPPPTMHLALHNGQLVVRGSVADVMSIEGNGAMATDGALSGTVVVRVPDLAKLLSISPNTASIPASGNLTANVQLGGNTSSLEALRIDATFPEFNVKISEHQFTPVRPLHVELRNGQLVFDAFQFALKDTASTFGIAGFVEMRGAKRVNLDVRGTLEAALLQLFIKDVRADGHINVALGLHGALPTPTLSGTAEFRDAQVRFAGFPQIIDHITGTLRFREDRVDIDSLKLTLGGGTVTAGGSITLAGYKPQRVRVVLQGTDVAIRYFEGVTVQGSFNPLVIAGDASRITVQGDIDVTRGLYFKDVDLGNAILGVILARKTVTPIVAASWQDKVSLAVHLTAAQGTLAIRNNIADVTGSGTIDVTGTLANPAILGEVTLDEGGKVRFQNIDYQIVRGTVSFQNPFRVDPFFDVTLEARVSGGISEIESGPLTVTVNITGTIDRISPSITSDPPASDVTLFSLLGLGGLTTKNGTQEPTNAALAGRSLLFQSAARLLGSRVLPFVDSFSYDVSGLDTSGDPGPKVSFEKRISENFRLFLVYNTRDQKRRVVIEWQVNPEWTVEFKRDEMSSEYATDARFRKRYQGHWTWGNQGNNAMAFFAHFMEPPKRSKPPATRPPVPPPPGAPVVTAISFTADSKFDTTVLGQYVSQRVGEPLSTREVQSSIKSLFDTGDFRDIRVDSKPSDGGVTLTFALFVNYRVAEIKFDGLNGADRDRATRELTFHVGDVLSLNAVDRGAVAVQSFLNRSGYLEATVDPETNFSRDQSRASVVLHVDRGPRATVGTVLLEGNAAPFTPQDLIGQMRRGPGKTFQLNDARLDADRIRNFLVRRNYRKADIRFLNYTYNKDTKQVALRYRAITGPIVQVEVAGVSKGDVKGLIPFRKNQGYSEDAIETASNEIVKSYQSRGYFNAAADAEERLVGNTWVITFHVNPGLRYQLTAVTFSGNEKISDKQLAGVVTTSVPGGIRSFLASLLRRPTGVTKAQINADRDAIESYYRLNGFSEVQVETPVVKTNIGGTMTVDFPIVEGPQTLLADVRVEGNQQVATKDLPDLQLKPGAPLNPQLERLDIVALQTFYGDRGNTEVQVKPREDVSADKTSATVTYVIAEGPEIKVDQVIVRGNTYTNSNVVLKQSDVDKGDPFSYTGILQAQRNLYRLGIFNRVDVQAEQVGTSVSDRNVVISVEEGKDLTVSGSLGFTSPMQSGISKASLLGSASIAHRNLFGTGRYVGLEVIETQNRSRQDAFITYREPFVGPWEVPVQLTLFQSDDLRRGSHLRQRGTFVEASKVVGLQTRWSVRYEYRISDCIIESPGDVCDQALHALLPGVDRSITNIRISSLTPTFFWDKRDDPLDPHRGFFTSASVQYAFRALNADAHFLKEFTQGSWYLPVTQRSVFAVSGRVGLIQPLGQIVPLSERFTAGGESSHRAYALDLLGTLCLDPDNRNCRPTLILLEDGKVAPIGGNGLLVANAEYRFPIFSTVGGAIFADAGNVFADTAISLGDLRYGVGTGVRYLSPVGPVRFDFGWKLKRQLSGCETPIVLPDLSRVCGPGTGKQKFEKPFAWFITLGYAF